MDGHSTHRRLFLVLVNNNYILGEFILSFKTDTSKLGVLYSELSRSVAAQRVKSVARQFCQFIAVG